MAEISLESYDDGRVFVVIPNEYAERFRYEALFTLETAAQRIEEVGKFTRRAREEGKTAASPASVDPQELREFHDAEEVYTGAIEEPFAGSDIEPPHEGSHIIGRAATIKSTVTGCVLDAAEAIHAEAEKRNGNPRRPMAELDFWLNLRERIEEAA